MDPREIARGRGRSVNFLVGIYITSESRITGWVREMFGTESVMGLQRLRNRITIEIRGLMGRTPEAARDVVRESLEAADALVARRRASGRRSALSTKATDILIDNLVNSLQDAGNTVGRRVDDIYRREALRASLRELEVSQPVEVSAEQMRARLEREGLTGFVDKAGRRWRLGTYARMATRTTASQALAQGTAEKMLERGFDLVEVSSHGCSHHPKDPAHPCVALEGETLRLGSFELPPFHPNAVMAGTRVEPVGAMNGAVRAEWNGPLVHLASAGGVELAIGPNHPVLTARGWLAAKLLREGDYVIRRCAPEWMHSPTVPPHGEANEDLDHAPPLIEQIFDALAAAGCATRVPAAPAHLHGDGNFCQGEIDVVRADSLLEDGSMPSLAQPVANLELVGAGAGLPLLPGQSTAGLPLEGLGATIGRTLSYDDACGAETAQESAVGEVATIGEALSRFAGAVALDEIVQVRNVDRWAGQAFDLETDSSTYFADGLLVHNCTHFITPSVRNFESTPELVA